MEQFCIFIDVKDECSKETDVGLMADTEYEGSNIGIIKGNSGHWIFRKTTFPYDNVRL